MPQAVMGHRQEGESPGIAVIAEVLIAFFQGAHGFREPHHIRIRDSEEIAWLMKYARGIDWKAPERKDAEKPGDKKTTDQ